MIATAAPPGLYVQIDPSPREPAPLRTDIAGFIGRARRGPIGCPVRVEGWNAYLRAFGGLVEDAEMPYAVRGYFENGGEVAHVIRLASQRTTVASARWEVAALDEAGRWKGRAPEAAGFQGTSYDVEASSPGTWANGMRVEFRYEREGPDGEPAVDIKVEAPREPVEYLRGLDPKRLEESVAAASVYIRLRARNPGAAPQAAPKAGPRHMSWDAITLGDGSEGRPSVAEYQGAVRLEVDTGGKSSTPAHTAGAEPMLCWGDDERRHAALSDLDEVALIAAPDLYGDLVDDEARATWKRLLDHAIEQRDRLVLVHAPPQDWNAEELAKWAHELIGDVKENDAARAAALYHPYLAVSDPLGGTSRPLRFVPPVGHIAGVISRLDRARGAHHTPANAELFGAVDVGSSFDTPSMAFLYEKAINLLRCFSNRGILVWGGRTLEADPSYRFVAHRRLIHRLVRAIRRVAEPLVFDSNGPALWLSLVRAITTVLLSAYEAGALKGSRPEEAFRVRCDASTNAPERERGLVLCEIELAPAVPMEFILLRIAVSSEGRLEVFE